MRVRYLKESDASAAHHSGDELGSVSDKSSEILSAHATWVRTTLKRTIIRIVVTIMDNTNLFSEDPESLLASDSEDEELYVPTQRKLARRITISAALTVISAAVLLATMVLWLSLLDTTGAFLAWMVLEMCKMRSTLMPSSMRFEATASLWSMMESPKRQ